MLERKDYLDPIKNTLRRGRDWVDRYRLTVTDFSDADRDRLVIAGSLTGLGIGLGADALSPVISASIRHGLVFAGAEVWQNIERHPFETVIVTTTVGIIGSTFISLTAKSVEGPSIDPPQPPRRKR